jgi:hypothetical protein
MSAQIQNIIANSLVYKTEEYNLRCKMRAVEKQYRDLMWPAPRQGGEKTLIDFVYQILKTQSQGKFDPKEDVQNRLHVRFNPRNKKAQCVVSNPGYQKIYAFGDYILDLNEKPPMITHTSNRDQYGCILWHTQGQNYYYPNILREFQAFVKNVNKILEPHNIKWVP